MLQGLPFAGMNTIKTTVLYFAAEESAEEWDLAIHPHLPANATASASATATHLPSTTDPDLRALRLALDRYRAGLIVVDPLLAACDSGDFANASRARNALTGLKILCMEKGVAAIVVHHAKERRAAPPASPKTPNSPPPPA